MALEDGIDYVNVYYDLEVTHDQDGWQLDDMTWYPEDGMACFQYERAIPGVGLELAVIWRKQPAHTSHEGWQQREKTERVFSLSECDWLRWERGIDLNPVDFDAN